MQMLYNILMDVSGSFAHFVTAACTFMISFVSILFFRNILPKDQGREFAVNGALSQGKPRGAGIVFVTTFTLCVALFVPLSLEFILYLVFIYAAMMSGYLDDAAEVPWGNLKKGLIDLVIALGSSITYYAYNGSRIRLFLFDTKIHIPMVIFIILGAVLVWTAINVTNCTDGVDGLCATLVMIVIAFLMFSGLFRLADRNVLLIMLITLGAYLWFNCSPSMLLMGDAGSRALGVFLAIVFMRSQAPFLFVPFAIVIILDGGLGLLKVSFIRFLKIKGFMKNIRTPLHDHARKIMGWSDTQVVMRFALVQILCSTLYLSFIR